MGGEEDSDCIGGTEQFRGGARLAFKSRDMILGKEASQWHLRQASSSSKSVIDLTQERLKRKEHSDQCKKPPSYAQFLEARGQKRASNHTSSYGDLKLKKQNIEELVISLEQKIEGCQKQVDEGKQRLEGFQDIKQADVAAVEKIKRVLQKLEKEKKLLEEKLMARTDLVTKFVDLIRFKTRFIPDRCPGAVQLLETESTDEHQEGTG